jgi:hypothetical protein
MSVTKIADKLWARVLLTKTKKKCLYQHVSGTHLIYELKLKEYQWQFCITVWAGIVVDCLECPRVRPNVLSNTYYAQRTGRGHTAWPPRSTLHARFESSGFLPVEAPEHPCVCSSCWQRRDTSPSHCGCLSDSPQLPRHLCTDVTVLGEKFWGAHWISWRTFCALILNVLFQL